MMIKNNAHDKIDSAIHEIDKLRRNLKKSSTAQVRSRDERDLIKATGLAWFNGHLPTVQNVIGEDSCSDTNSIYRDLIGFSDRATTRTKYDSLLKALKRQLSQLRTTTLSAAGVGSTSKKTTDNVPDFSGLIGDSKMQQILGRRWNECVVCITSGAPLAATVMMGGLLETLLLARLNREANKSVVFKAAAAPRNKKTKKVLELKEWTLRHYLDVGHELGWIGKGTKDVGEVVRDFRNYVHPYKQASHEVNLDSNDARLFWEISKEITRQLLQGAR